jgi:hypothetical protein
MSVCASTDSYTSAFSDHFIGDVFRHIYTKELNGVFSVIVYDLVSKAPSPGHRSRAALSSPHDARLTTAGAFYDKNVGQFILPYDAVRQASDPETLLLDFLQETYAAAADLAKWDRKALERAEARRR